MHQHSYWLRTYSAGQCELISLSCNSAGVHCIRISCLTIPWQMPEPAPTQSLDMRHSGKGLLKLRLWWPTSGSSGLAAPSVSSEPLPTRPPCLLSAFSRLQGRSAPQQQTLEKPHSPLHGIHVRQMLLGHCTVQHCTPDSSAPQRGRTRTGQYEAVLRSSGGLP